MSHFSKEIHDSGDIKKVSTILVLDKADNVGLALPRTKRLNVGC